MANPKTTKRDGEVRFRANVRDQRRVAKLCKAYELTMSALLRRLLADAEKALDAQAKG